MLAGQDLTFIDTLYVSLLGILVVFSALVALDLAVMIIGKVINAIQGAGKNAASMAAPVKSAPAVSDEADKELLAVLASVIAEDLGVATDQFRITSVTEIK